MSPETVILSACRTATGRFLGTLSEIPAVRPGGIVIADGGGQGIATIIEAE